MVQQRRYVLGSPKSRPVSPIPDLDPYSGLFGLSVLQKVLAQHPATNTSSSDPYRGKKEQTVYVGTPLMPGTMVSQHFGIPSFGGNPVSSVQAGDNDSTSSALSG